MVSSLATVGTAVATTGAGLVGLVTNIGMAFDSQISTVQALSGATIEEIEILTVKAKELGSSTSFSATEVAQGFEYMALAGWNTSQMLDGIDGILYAAAASGETLATVSDIVTDGLTALGLSAEDSGRMADVLATTSSSANTSLYEMGEALKYVAPAAGTLEFSLEDVSLAIGLMGDAGIKGSQAGTSLRMAINRLISPTDDGADALSNMGIEVANADGTMREFDDILQDLRVGFEDLTAAEKAQTATTIFGTEASSGMLAIINANEDAYNNLSESIRNSAGQAELMAAIMLDNLEGDLTIMKSSLEGLSLQFYATFSEDMREAVQEFTSLVNNVSTALSEGGIQGAVEEIGVTISYLAIVILEQAPLIVEGVTTLITSFINALLIRKDDLYDSFRELLTALFDSMQDLMPDLQALASTIAPLVAEAIATGYPLMLQVGLEILTGIVTGISNNADEIINAGLNSLEYFIQSIISNLPLLIEASLKIIVALAEGLSNNAPQIASSITTIISTIITEISNNLPAIIEAGFQIGIELFKAFVSTISEVAGTLSDELGLLGVVIASTVAGFMTFQAVTTLMSTVATVVGAVSTAVGIFSSALTALTSVVTGVTTVTQVLHALWLANPIGLVATAIGLLVAGILLLTTDINSLKETLLNVWEYIKTVTTSIIENVSSKFTELGNILTQFFSNFGVNLQSFFNSTTEKFSQLWGEVVNSATTFVTNIGTSLSNGFNTLITTVSNFGTQLVSGFTSMFSNAISTVQTFINNISSAFSSFSWTDVGKNIVSGIVSGVTSMMSTAVSSIKNVASSMYSAATSFFDIHSPSRLMAEVGGYIVEGMADGVDNNSSLAVNSMNDMFHLIEPVLMNEAEALSSMYENIFEDLQDIASSETIEEVGIGVVPLIDYTEILNDDILQNVKTIFNEMPTVVESNISEVASIIQDEISVIADFLNSVGEQIVTNVSTSIENAINIVDNGLERISSSRLQFSQYASDLFNSSSSSSYDNINTSPSMISNIDNSSINNTFNISYTSSGGGNNEASSISDYSQQLASDVSRELRARGMVHV